MESQRSVADAALLRSAIAALGRRLRAQDSIGGIGPTGLSLLGRLLRTGGASASELARLEGLQPQSLTRSLKGLENMGLIERRVDEKDRRRAAITISPLGAALVRDAMRARVAWLACAIESGLNEEERETLREATALIERMARGDAAR